MASKDQFDFGAGLKELESITAWFESDNVNLDEGLAKFERGMELADKLKTHLAATQNRIEQVKSSFDQPAKSPPASQDDQLPL